MTSYILRATVAGLGVAMLAACGDSVETPSTTADVGAAVSAAQLGDLATYQGAASVLGMASTGEAPAIVPSSCTFTTGTQGFTCPAQSVGGLTFNTTYFLLDASGQTQSSTSSTTDGVRVVSDVTGTVTRELGGNNMTADVTHHGDLRVNGLVSGPRVVNGTSTDHDVLTSTGSTSGHTVIDVASTTANLVLPSSNETWPQSGTITSDAMAVTTLGILPAITTTAHAVLTFNGTNMATLVATVSGHATTCDVDLSGAKATVCH